MALGDITKFAKRLFTGRIDFVDSGKLYEILEKIEQAIASSGNSESINIVKTVTKEITTNIIPEPDGELEINVEANDIWIFKVYMHCNGSNIRLHMGESGGVTGIIEYELGEPDSNLYAFREDFTTDSNITLSGTKSQIIMRGVLKAATSGKLQVYWAQTASSGTPTRVHETSFMQMTKVN